jgi:rhodanese-related sulfurtransferase
MRIALFTALFLLLTLWSCRGQVRDAAYKTMLKSLLSHTVRELSVEEAKKQSKAVFLDAREPNEYKVSHIPGSYPVGYDHFNLHQLPPFPKDTPIIVYCSVGYRSEKISEQLLQAGYSNVANLYGGIFEWVNQNQPVVNQQGPTQQVHAFNRSWGVWLKKGEKVY